MFETPYFNAKLTGFTTKKNPIAAGSEIITASKVKLTFQSELKPGSSIFDEICDNYADFSAIELTNWCGEIKVDAKKEIKDNKFIVHAFTGHGNDMKHLFTVKKVRFDKKISIWPGIRNENVNIATRMEFKASCIWVFSLDGLTNIEDRTVQLYIEPDNDALGKKPDLSNVQREDGIFFEDTATVSAWLELSAEDRSILLDSADDLIRSDEKNPVTQQQLTFYTSLMKRKRETQEIKNKLDQNQL